MVLPVEDVDLTRLRFTTPIPNKRGGKFVLLSYQHSPGKTGPLLIQTPKCRAPFGVSTYNPGVGSEGVAGSALAGAAQQQAGIKSISLSFDNIESDAAIRRFLELTAQFDEAVIKTAVANGKTWFPFASESDQTNETIIRYNYVKTTRMSPPKKDSNMKYPPLMKLKVPLTTDGKPALPVFEGTDRTSLEAIQRGAQMVNIIEANCLWFVGKSFGSTWRIVQARVEPGKAFEEYAFLDDLTGSDELPTMA